MQETITILWITSSITAVVIVSFLFYCFLSKILKTFYTLVSLTEQILKEISKQK